MWQDEVAKQGFVIIPDVLTRRDIATILSNLNNENAHPGRAGLRHALALPGVAGLAWDPSLLKIARGVLGKKALPYRATLFDKSPRANWLVAWHQDRALPETSRYMRWGPLVRAAGNDLRPCSGKRSRQGLGVASSSGRFDRAEWTFTSRWCPEATCKVF
jgi:hypothetical protein